MLLGALRLDFLGKNITVRTFRVSHSLGMDLELQNLRGKRHGTEVSDTLTAPTVQTILTPISDTFSPPSQLSFWLADHSAYGMTQCYLYQRRFIWLYTPLKQYFSKNGELVKQTQVLYKYLKHCTQTGELTWMI